MTDEDGFTVLSEITIRRGIDQDGSDVISIDLPTADTSSLIEILGMLDFARQSAWFERQGPYDDDEEV